MSCPTTDITLRDNHVETLVREPPVPLTQAVIDRFEVLAQTYARLPDSELALARHPAVAYALRPSLPRLVAVPRRAAHARRAPPVPVHPIHPAPADPLVPHPQVGLPQMDLPFGGPAVAPPLFHPVPPDSIALSRPSLAPAPQLFQPSQPFAAPGPQFFPPGMPFLGPMPMPMPMPMPVSMPVPMPMPMPIPEPAPAQEEPGPDPVGLAAAVVLEGIEVACTYPGCAHTVPLYRFAEHALAHHRAAPQAQLACPICPYAAECAAPDALQENLLMHLSDAHPRYMTAAVARRLQEYVTATLASTYAPLPHEQAQMQVQMPMMQVMQQGQRGHEQQQEQQQERPQVGVSPGLRVERVVQAQDSADECIICMVPFAAGDRVAVLECLCRFHEKCLDEWLAKKNCCPVHFASG